MLCITCPDSASRLELSSRMPAVTPVIPKIKSFTMAVPSVSFEAWWDNNLLHARARSTTLSRQCNCNCFNTLAFGQELKTELQKQKNELEKQKKELDEQKNELEKQKKQVAGLLQTVGKMRVALGVEVQAVPNCISDVESTDGTSADSDSDCLDSDDCGATNNKRRKLAEIMSAPTVLSAARWMYT